MAIAFVQAKHADPTGTATPTATFTNSQAAGNLIVVAVSWSSGSTVNLSSVTDSKGNTYAQAVAKSLHSAGNFAQTIYYAKNIASATAGSNTVTATLSGSVSFPDIRVVEYSGLDTTSPFDTGTSATSVSNGTTATVGPISTSLADELLFVGGAASTGYTGAGSGFTSRGITSNTGSIYEDRIVSSTGSYSGTATLTSGQWLVQIASFKAPGGMDPASSIRIWNGSAWVTSGVSKIRTSGAWVDAVDPLLT